MTPIRARVLSNMVLPNVPAYTIKTFGDYLPTPTFEAPWQAQFERRTLAEILPLIPRSEKPDILIIASPEYLPIPVDVADFTGLKILLITDWNICLRFLPALCPLFNVCFTDWPGTRLLKSAGITHVKHQPLFGHDPDTFRNTNVTRNLDVSFCGNLNSGIHGERNRLLARLGQWSAKPLELGGQVSSVGILRSPLVHLRPTFGKEYVDVLNRSKLVFNYSIRGEANMRLFESMACGAVPLIEETNLESGILFEEGKHFFRYKLGQLENKIESLLKEPELLTKVSESALEAVKTYSKAHQIESLLNLSTSDFTTKPASNSIQLPSPTSVDSTSTSTPLAPPPLAKSSKTLIKLNVLGLGFTLKSAVEEIQKYSAKFPGLEIETMPALLFSILTQEKNQEPFPLLSSAVNSFLYQPSIPEIVRKYLAMHLAFHKDDFTKAILEANSCLALLEKPEQLDLSLYEYFLPPLELGKAFNTDLNQVYGDDLKNGQALHYLNLLRANCFLVLGESHFALTHYEAAVTQFLQMNLNAFSSFDVYHSLIKALFKLNDHESIRKLALAWFDQKPLDTEVWRKLAKVYKRLGEKTEMEIFSKKIFSLAHLFFDAKRAKQILEIGEQEST